MVNAFSSFCSDSYHIQLPCPSKCLQPCLILVSKAVADVHLCHLPILISCKTNGVLYLYLWETGILMVNDSNNRPPRHLSIPTWIWANISPVLCGILSLDLDCNHHFDKAGTPQQRRPEEEDQMDAARIDSLSGSPKTAFPIFLSLFPSLHLIYC